MGEKSTFDQTIDAAVEYFRLENAHRARFEEFGGILTARGFTEEIANGKEGPEKAAEAWQQLHDLEDHDPLYQKLGNELTAASKKLQQAFFVLDAPMRDADAKYFEGLEQYIAKKAGGKALAKQLTDANAEHTKTAEDYIKAIEAGNPELAAIGDKLGMTLADRVEMLHSSSSVVMGFSDRAAIALHSRMDMSLMEPENSEDGVVAIMGDGNSMWLPDNQAGEWRAYNDALEAARASFEATDAGKSLKQSLEAASKKQEDILCKLDISDFCVLKDGSMVSSMPVDYPPDKEKFDRTAEGKALLAALDKQENEKQKREEAVSTRAQEILDAEARRPESMLPPEGLTTQPDVSPPKKLEPYMPDSGVPEKPRVPGGKGATR
jgi:hypothetical protein